MDTSVLEDLGLSNAEARVYVCLLEKGSCQSGKIIDSTNLQSSTVYHVLGSLLEKGLVGFILRGKTKFFQAQDPESFLVFLEEKKRRFNEFLPLLRERQKEGFVKQSASVFQGANGLKAAFNQMLSTLKKGGEYCVFQFPNDALFDEKIILFLRNYHLRRAAKGVRVRLLALDNCRQVIKKIFHDVPLTKIRFLREFAPTGITLYENNVMILDLDEPQTAFLISSKSVYESYKKFFEEKWAKARA